MKIGRIINGWKFRYAVPLSVEPTINNNSRALRILSRGLLGRKFKIKKPYFLVGSFDRKDV